MIILLTGIALLGLTIYRIRREKRRFSNAISLLLSLVLMFLGFSEMMELKFPSLAKLGGGQYAVTGSGELRFFAGMLLHTVIIIAGILLIINGYRLLKREGKSLAHLLPVLFGLLCIAFVFSYYIYLFHHTGNSWKQMVLSVILKIAFYGTAYLPFVLIAYGLYYFVYKILVHPKKCDYIIVLGARIIGERVSPLLAGRLDKGIALYEKFRRKPVFIVSGGKGSDEIISEAEAMKRYLLEKGIEEEHIILEDRSVNTRQNLKFSGEIMDARSENYNCLFVTNNFHVLRGAILAKELHIPADGVGCKTAGYYLPAASIREAIAFVFAYEKMALYYLLLAVIVSVIQVLFP